MGEFTKSEETLPFPVEGRDSVASVQAIKDCLDYLQRETQRLDMLFAAHLIGVASEAVRDSISLASRVRANDIGQPRVGLPTRRED